MRPGDCSNSASCRPRAPPEPRRLRKSRPVRESQPQGVQHQTSPYAGGQAAPAALGARYAGLRPQRARPRASVEAGKWRPRFRSASSDISHNRDGAACRPSGPAASRRAVPGSQRQPVPREGAPRPYGNLGASNLRKTGTLRGPWPAHIEQQVLTRSPDFSVAE